jgi:hypothetical protein
LFFLKFKNNFLNKLSFSIKKVKINFNSNQFFFFKYINTKFKRKNKKNRNLNFKKKKSLIINIFFKWKKKNSYLFEISNKENQKQRSNINDSYLNILSIGHIELKGECFISLKRPILGGILDITDI